MADLPAIMEGPAVVSMAARVVSTAVILDPTAAIMAAITEAITADGDAAGVGDSVASRQAMLRRLSWIVP